MFFSFIDCGGYNVLNCVAPIYKGNYVILVLSFILGLNYNCTDYLERTHISILQESQK